MLRVAGIRYADLKGYSYGRADVTGRGLANAYSQGMGQIFTHEVKPYEVEVIVAEIGDDADATQLFRVQFDGTLVSENGFGAIGGEEDALRERLADGYEPDPTLDEAVVFAAGAIEAVEERTVPADEWEAAVLDRTLGRRKFRRLTAEDVAAARSRS
jgi:proteasome alpha subunit